MGGVTIRRQLHAPVLQLLGDLGHVGDVTVVGQADAGEGIEEGLGIGDAAAAVGAVARVGDPEIPPDIPQGLEDVVREPLALLQAYPAANRIEKWISRKASWSG